MVSTTLENIDVPAVETLPDRIVDDKNTCSSNIDEDGIGISNGYDECKVLTPIQQFYKGKAIFLTGATGFLGKVIMEKLLRCCDIDTIYILIRSKKGKSVISRCDEIFDDAVFDKLKHDFPKFRHKIIGITGDCTLTNLGMSDADRLMLIERANIVFHVAATVRFDEKLKLALDINVSATRDVMRLCGAIKNLKAMVHVSTAYANCNRFKIDERTYTPYISGENAIQLTKCLDDKTLDSITPQIIRQWPNTYTFTKCLAEDLVRQMSKGIPATIFRPAIVIPTYREPVSGWIDNMYGPTGIVVGVGSGLLRIFHINPDNVAELVPVDMCVNAMLASAWDVAQQHKSISQITTTPDDQLSASTSATPSTSLLYDDFELPVYNYVASPQNPITWKEYCDLSVEFGSKVPMIKSIWYYRFTMTSSKLLALLLTFFYHTIPAFLMDMAMMSMGKKPKMMQIYKKIHKFCDAIGYFTTKRWYFTNSNVQNLWHKLDPADQKLFFFDMADIKWNEVISLGIFGIRTYLMKEDPDTIPKALIRTKRLKFLHYFTVYSVYALIVYFLYTLVCKYLTFWLPLKGV